METEAKGHDAQERPSLEAAETTLDGMFQKRILLRQSKAGYRFSVDAVLLSLWATRFASEEVLDLGCGCGVIPLIMADLWEKRGLFLRGTGVEIQASLAALARENVEANARQGQVTIVETDVRSWQAERPWPLITCNPPYQGRLTGSVNPNPERAAARHEVSGCLEELMKAARRLLDPKGRLLVVFPAPSLPRLFSALASSKLFPSRLCLVYPKADREARLVLVEASGQDRPLLCDPGLILYRSSGVYTAAVTALFQGECSTWEDFLAREPSLHASKEPA